MLLAVVGWVVREFGWSLRFKGLRISFCVVVVVVVVVLVELEMLGGGRLGVLGRSEPERIS